MQPSKKLEQLALIALKAEMKSKEAAAAYKEAQLAFIEQAEAEGMLNPDTKAIGPVQTIITPNRFFDVDYAITLVSEADVLESTVEVVDAKLLKQHMTPIQTEQAMKFYPNPYKVGFKVNK